MEQSGRMRSLLIAMVAVCLLVLAMPLLADDGYIFGNDIPFKARSMTDSGSNFVALDLGLEEYYSPVISPGQITRWHWYASSLNTNAKGQQMNLMVWRPVANTESTYELVFSQLVTSKVWKAQWVDVDYSAANGSPYVQVGDVLGYYVPEGNSPVLALDWTPGTSTGDWYWLNSGVLTPGTQHEFDTRNGLRTYSLNVDVVPVPELGTIFVAIGVLAPAGLAFRGKHQR